MKDHGLGEKRLALLHPAMHLAKPIDQLVDDSQLHGAEDVRVLDSQTVQLGEEKPALYEGKTPEQRLALQTSFIRRMASLSGSAGGRIARADWPGEIFDIDERNGRLC